MDEFQISPTTFKALKLDKGNLGSLCRLCLTDKNVQPFFKLSYNGFLMCDIFTKVTSLAIKFDDNFPHRICVKCIEKLLTTYIFIQKCQKLDNYLHSFLKVSVETQSVENEMDKEIVERESVVDEIVDETDELASEILHFENEINNHTAINHQTETFSKNNVESSSHLTKYKDVFSEDQLQNENMIVELYEDNSVESNYIEEIENGTDIEDIQLTATHACSNCKISFNSVKDFNEHYKTSYKCKSLKRSCRVCGKYFKTNAKLKIHERIHTNEKPFECNICGKTFSIAQNLRRHKRVHTGEKPFLCEICGKRFTRLLTKNEHMRLHVGEKPYDCKICNKAFFRLGYFKMHMRKHESDDKHLKCPHCSKIYVTSKTFNLHVKRHSVADPKLETKGKIGNKYLCNLCGKTFSSTGSLKIHLSSHSGSMEYTCEVCNKRFCYKSSLVKHSLIHTGDRPYSCSYCKKSFMQSVHLRQHLRVHTGEKPFSCDMCGKSFALSCNLIVHKRIHTGETPYKCLYCNRGFYDSSSMKKHQKTHGNTKTFSNV